MEVKSGELDYAMDGVSGQVDNGAVNELIQEMQGKQAIDGGADLMNANAAQGVIQGNNP